MSRKRERDSERKVVNNGDAQDAEKLLLKREPTAERWQAELFKVLNGQRESDLLHYESVEEHVDKILDLSPDRARAKLAFDKALYRVVQTWQPVRRETKEYLACLLDLIGAYTPLNGAHKLLGFLSRWGRFEDDLESSGGYGAHHDLNLKALVALGSCLDAAPQATAEDARLFKQYVDLLREQLSDDEYGWYAATRLIELSLLPLEHEEIGALIKRSPRVLRSLVSLVFSKARRSRFERDLQSLFVHAVEGGDRAFRAFEQTLQDRRASLKIRDGVVILDAPGRSRTEFTLSNAAQRKHMELLLRREMRLDELQELLSEATRHAKARMQVTRIYEDCLDKHGGEGARHFQDEIQKHNARLVEVVEKPPVVKLRNGTSFELSLSDRSFNEHMVRVRWQLGEMKEAPAGRHEQKEAVTELREILKSKSATNNGG
jgi:hypothetical protein